MNALRRASHIAPHPCLGFSPSHRVKQELKPDDLRMVRSLVWTDALAGVPETKALMSSPHLSHIDSLSIGRIPFGDAGAHLLANTPSLASLSHLDLFGIGLGDEGVVSLARSPYLSLERLSLHSNKVGPRGVRALAHTPVTRALRELNLGRNTIGDEGLAAITQSTYASNLNRLYLMHASIGVSGARALAQAIRFNQLRDLDMAYNSVGDEGVEELLKGAGSSA